MSDGTETTEPIDAALGPILKKILDARSNTAEEDEKKEDADALEEEASEALRAFMGPGLPSCEFKRTNTSGTVHPREDAAHRRPLDQRSARDAAGVSEGDVPCRLPGASGGRGVPGRPREAEQGDDPHPRAQQARRVPNEGPSVASGRVAAPCRAP